MSGRQFRVGIIGLGMMGHALAQTCQAEAEVELVAGCNVAAAATPHGDVYNGAATCGSGSSTE